MRAIEPPKFGAWATLEVALAAALLLLGLILRTRYLAFIGAAWLLFDLCVYYRPIAIRLYAALNWPIGGTRQTPAADEPHAFEVIVPSLGDDQNGERKSDASVTRTFGSSDSQEGQGSE